MFAETAKGNGRPFLEAFAQDARWTVTGTTGWSRTYEGKAAILSDLIGPLRRVLAPPLKTHAHRFIADGDFVAVQGRGENRTHDGRPYENDYCWVFEFQGRAKSWRLRNMRIRRCSGACWGSPIG